MAQFASMHACVCACLCDALSFVKHNPIVHLHTSPVYSSICIAAMFSIEPESWILTQ